MSKMIQVSFPRASVAKKRAARGLLLLACTVFVVACTRLPLERAKATPPTTLAGRLVDVLGYWQAEERADLMFGIEEDRFTSAVGGRIREVSGILELSEDGVRLCQFGHEVFRPIEKSGSSLILHDPAGAESHRLRRLREKPSDLLLKSIAFVPPLPLPEARVRGIERELARRLEIDQEFRRPKPKSPIPRSASLPWMLEPVSGTPAEDQDLLIAVKTAQNTEYLRALVLEVGWIDAGRFSFDASNAAFLLVQHSGDISLMLAALPWIKVDAEHDRMDWEPYALLFDRLRLSLGKRQRYGTQLWRDGTGDFVVLPVEDEGRLNEFRSEAGLIPLTQYVKIFGAPEVRLSAACRPRS